MIYDAESCGDFFIDWTSVAFVKLNRFSDLLGVDTEMLIDENEWIVSFLSGLNYTWTQNVNQDIATEEW